MQTANRPSYCLGQIMDSNDNVTATIPHSTALESPKRSWKDFCTLTNIRPDTTTMAESGNANSKVCLLQSNIGGGGDDGGGGEIGSSLDKLDQKVQITDGPVIRMGMGAVTSRREVRSHPDSLSMKGQGVMATWKDVSPPKEKRNLLDGSLKEKKLDGGKAEEGLSEEKNRNPIRTNPFHEGSGMYRGTDGSFQSVKRIKTDQAVTNSSEMQSLSYSGSENPDNVVAVVAESAAALTTWRDVSPTKPQEGRKRRPESGYFSNDVQSEGGQESREEIDSSLSDSDSGQKERSNSSGAGGEEGCFHSSDYFYEDEFSVQFDTNLREAVAAGEQGAQEDVIPPQSLNGSYTKFRDSLLQADLYLGPYESELSGSRTSMEISSSEREMMCSSDMLNFSNDPLFTPTPPPAEQIQQNVSVDSLSHQGQGCEMGNSRSSNDPNLGVDCCIRKDAYFLSFNGSQHRSSSESDISYVSQGSFQEGPQDGDSQSDSSHGQDAEDEGSKSNSFQFPDDGEDEKSPNQPNPSPPVSYCRPVRNMLLSRYPGRICLEALQDYLLSRSSSSKSAGSSRHSCSSHCKLSPLNGTLLSSGDLFMSGGHRRGLRRSNNLTTWKQVKSLKKLGREQNLHERSNSMPNLTAEDVKVVRREKPHENIESMADSFHKKRHSAYILELYQRLMMGSNPPSPTTLSRVDQILFKEGFGQDNQAQEDGANKDCSSCPSCGACGNKKDFHLDLHRDVQCGRSLCSAATSMSPQTLTLWYGQKNFSSQFPPHTADCGVQACVGDEGSNLNNRSMQTSPGSPGAEILNVLHELQAKEARESRYQKREKPPMTRAKSATECRDTHAERLKAQMRRTVSLSPSRIGMNSFYTHQSLPDLSFLIRSSRPLSKSRDSSSSAISLFDPVQIPIILTPVVEDGARSSHLHSRSPASSGCSCGREIPQGAMPPRRCRRNSSGRSGDFTSSGSNFSLSSSSGIEPGYVEPRSLIGLAPELEHLLFYPPHLESAYHQLGLSEMGHRAGNSETKMGEEEPGPASPTRRCSNAKIDRYANEAHPCVAQVARAVKQNQRHSGNPGPSTDSPNPDRLDALKEEKTPSPEPSYCHYPPRDYTDYHCFGCHDASEGESSQEMDEDKFMMYQRWLQDRKPPLKSCLRKRCIRDHKARSLSNLSYQEKPELPPEKPPRKQNRHSIACDGMMPVLVDEEGFEYHSSAPCCPPYPSPQLHHSPLTQEYAGEKVVLRRKKPAVTISEGSVEGSIDDSTRAKRVSFASEVSFHSPNYTPQCSPRRQPGEGEVTAVQMEDDILTLHVVRRNRTAPHCMEPDKDTVEKCADSKPSPAADAGTAAELSPLDHKASVVRNVIQAAEALVQHFAQARDPFDKVRLGSSQESSEVGSLVVTSLCPALERVMRDGMKMFLTGLHIFGKIQLSPWRVTESAAETGPYTRAIHELVKQLKVRPSLVSHRQKFYAFLAGLLNLRLLDFWMGYLSTKDSITSRFYDEGSILHLSHSALERQYQDMLLALQPLAVLPFQIDYEIIAGYSLADSSYMGESDIELASPKKQELSTSPKIVVARAKTTTGTSPNRSSWAGPTDRRDSSVTRSDRMDFSATWDWIKTTTLPKARSLMSDMGLMSSTASVSTVTESGPSSTVKTSRLSQDLASVGIVSSRQSISITATSSSPEVTQKCPTVQQKDEEMDEPRFESSLSNKSRVTLPAVVMDHGTKRKVEVSPARQKAEDILRRKGEISPQRKWSKVPSTKAESTQGKEMIESAGKESSDLAHCETRKDLTANQSSSPQKVSSNAPQSSSPQKVSTNAPQRRLQSSPIQIQNSPTSTSRQSSSPNRQSGSPSRQSGSPSRQSGSPSRQSGSPSRQSGSPSHQSGSPSRGPLINPGSPKSTVAGARCTERVEVISRRAAKVVLDDFPEDDDSKTNQPGTLHSPLAAVSSTVQKLLSEKEEKVYREGKTEYAFDATAQCPQNPSALSPTSATAGSVAQATSPQNTNSNQTTGRSKFSGLKKLSPKGSFNIISFFDRLLLPSAGSSSPPAVKVPENTQKENSASEWDSTEQVSSVATGTSSTISSSTPSPTPPESLHTSSSTSNNSSPRAKIPKSQPKVPLGRVSRIPKRQAENLGAKNVENNSLQKVNGKTEKKTVSTNITRRSAPNQTPQPIPVATAQQTNRSQSPEVDINANSPEFHPSQPEQMFVEHNPIGQWGGSSSETGQSEGSGESVSMEEDQSRHASPAKTRGPGPLKMPVFKYVKTLVSCEPDEPDLLTYNLGDRLEVLARVNDDWLFCLNGRQEGLVRMAAVKPVSSQEVS